MDNSFQQHIEQLTKEGKKADQQDREKSEALAVLLRHPGWQVYTEMLNARIQLHSDVVLRPATSIDGAIGLEYVKGAMSGLILARDLPRVIVEAMKAAGIHNTDGDDDA